MVKEFVLIERVEYDQLKDNPSSNENEIVSNTTPGSSMLSTRHLLSAVKNKVGITYHNNVERLFEFLKAHPSLLTWTDFGEAIVNGIHLPGTNVHEMLDYLLVYVGPRVGAHICLNLGVGLDRILHHTAKYLRVVARLPLAIYISPYVEISIIKTRVVSARIAVMHMSATKSSTV